MIWKYGKEVPVHKRYNNEHAEEGVINRYRKAKEHIAKQVTELQSCKEFNDKCSQLYNKGYHDWVILMVILNCMLNLRSQERQVPLTPETMNQPIDELLSELDDLVYPCEIFMGVLFDRNLELHFITALQSWGFQLRRRILAPDVAEKFLRIRMKHFEFDLPHRNLFGTPPGDWPEL